MNPQISNLGFEPASLIGNQSIGTQVENFTTSVDLIASFSPGAIAPSNINQVGNAQTFSGNVLLGGQHGGDINIKDASTNNPLINIDQNGISEYIRNTNDQNLLKVFRSPNSPILWSKLFTSISSGFEYYTKWQTSGCFLFEAFEQDLSDFIVVKSYLQLNDNSDIGDATLYAKNNIHLIAGSVDINGSVKTAIVPTSKGYKALYTNESPEVWFMDFADSIETIDPLFLEVTEGYMKTIKCEDGSIQVWRRRKGFLGVRFEERTLDEFKRNNRFWSLAKKS
ncbi:MAG: hypothetical protein ACRDFB_10875 [Rhabdochlamydiaceae bacterium]